MRFNYYVAYMAGNIIGSCRISSSKKMNTMKTIESVSEYISRKYCDGAKAVIMNWKELL